MGLLLPQLFKDGSLKKMDDLNKIYNHGQPGIDTKIERDIINYDPVLEYIKDFVLKEDQKINEDYVPSEEMAFSTIYNLPAAKNALAKADNAVKQCLEALKEKLRDIKVEIKDEFVERETVLRSYAGGDFITFEIFDKACRESSAEARAVMYYYMEKANMMEALAYPDLIILEQDNANDFKFVDEIISLSDNYGYDPNNIEGSTTELLQHRYQLEVRKQELESVFASGNASLEDYQEYEQIGNVLNQLDKDETPTLSKLVVDRANQTEQAAMRIYGLTMSEIAELVGGNDSLNGFVYAVGLTDNNEANKIAKIRDRIAKIKKVVAVANAFSSMKAIEITDLIFMLLSPVIKGVANQLISFFHQLKVSVIKPPLDWLDELSYNTRLIPLKDNNLRHIDTNNEKLDTQINKSIDFGNEQVEYYRRTYNKLATFSQAVDKLAHTIIDVANDIESKFDDFILDYYRATKVRSDRLGDKFAHLEKKKWAETIDRMLETMLICLEAASDEMTFSSLDSVKSYVDRVKDKLNWNDNNTVSLNVPDILEEEMSPILEPTIEELNWRKNATDY